jgi:hypothetical protein
VAAEPVVVRLHIDAPPDVVFDVAASPASRFRALVNEFVSDLDVTPPEGSTAAGRRAKFGSNGLRFRNRIFAMLSRDRLVVKLPRPRVDALVAAGDGERMVSGGAREMKEWLVVAADSQLDWSTLAREARAFVAGQPADA